MAKRRDLDQERIAACRKQIALLESQRYKHKLVVDGAEARHEHLDEEILKRVEAIEQMQEEIAQLPVDVAHSRAVTVKLNDQISTFKFKIEQVKAKRRKQSQLARVRQQITALIR